MNVGDVLQGRYRIVRLVGQGGFGAVYRAWDMNLKVPVALKENADTGLDAQRQFEREAHLLANLRHANLPRVSDHFVIPGQGQYLVMDFVEGHSLAALLATRGGPLGEVEVRPWIRQVCDALEYLHSRTPPVIHRDIKPDNIIIGPDGRAMLVDFGISKEFAPGKGTTIGARAITPGYSPPEQYSAAGTDTRSDVYALGATLYHLLTGHEPPESVVLIGGGLLPAPRALNPAVSPAAEAAILAAMNLDIGRRLSSAAAFHQALDAPPAALRRDPASTAVVLPTQMAAPVAPARPGQPPQLAVAGRRVGHRRAGSGRGAVPLSAPRPFGGSPHTRGDRTGDDCRRRPGDSRSDDRADLNRYAGGHIDGYVHCHFDADGWASRRRAPDRAGARARRLVPDGR